MEPALQARIIARALELGILHQNDLDQAEVHLRQDTGVFPPSHWGRHLDILIRLGRIRAEEVENLHEELVSEIETSAGLVSNGNHALLETSNPELPLANPAPKTAPTSPRITVQEGFPVKNWDRYEFRKLLGRGGMGLVYQAWDPQLNRLVALKFLRTNNEQMTHRFLQEARSQSRIEDQNICKVYEAGEVEGLPYIAMQFIDGQSLRRVQKNLTLEQKVRLMRDIAQAIHAAHRLGIIHRDLKPDNILVVESEDGNFRPVVMDFGLAKEVGTEGLTETGVVMGTPAYMSPEQARGEVRLLDRRSDVYSLGVVFYEMLTGKLPFTDENAMKVVLKIINDEPLSVASRLNTIPLDLNIITMKCLEKDPSHRYDSAQALALDLQHYLDGDPISTRAQTWPSKLLKKARKHRALVTVSSVALGIVLLTGAFSLWSWWQLSKQAELTRQMGEQAEKIESLMRFASLTQPHDIRAERQMALAELELIRRRMQEAGRLGEGPGNYALGRGYLAFSDFEGARVHLERAYAAGFRTPGLDLALGKVLGEFYRREADSVSQIEDKEGREAQMKRLETEYTVPIQRHLSAYLQAQPQGATQESVYLEGLVALYRKNYDLAVKKSLAAGGQSSWFYEAKCLEGETYLAWCREKLGSGEHEAARSLLAKAKAAFEAAVLMGPSNLQALFGLARSETLNLDLVLNLEKLTQEPCDRALAACDKVLQLDPEYSQGLFLKSVVYFRMASFQQKEGEDPRPTLALAIEWSKHAQAVNPTESEAYQTMGSSYRLAGRYELDHGIDPRPSFDLAVASLRKAVQFKPTAHGPYNTMGLIFRSRGQYELEHGNNPFPDFDEAAVNFKKAIQLNPNYSNAYTNLGFLYRSRGDYERETGLDPRTSFEQAAASLERAIELNPNYPYADTHLGILRRVQGEYEWEHGRDPNPSFALAAAAFQKAIQTNKNYAFAHSNLGMLELVRGEYAEQSGTDPNPSFDRAEKSLNRALELNPKYNSAYQNLGMLELWRGLNTSNLGVDPLPFFAKATAQVQKALELNPKESESYVQMAMIAYEAAVYLSRCGRDPGKNLTEAQKHLEHALELNPRQLLPTYYLGQVKVKQAAWLLDKKENPSEFIQPAKQWLEKALAFRPDFDRTYYLQVELALVEARWALFEKRSPAAFFPVADAALEKAAQVKSNSAELYLLKARLQLEQAAWQTAQQQNPQTAISNGLAAVSQALKLNPLATEPLALKGALLQLQSQTLPNPTTTQEAMAILEEGLRKNQWLTFQYRPYLLQAQNQSRKP